MEQYGYIINESGVSAKAQKIIPSNGLAPLLSDAMDGKSTL